MGPGAFLVAEARIGRPAEYHQEARRQAQLEDVGPPVGGGSVALPPRRDARPPRKVPSVSRATLAPGHLREVG